MNVLIFYSLIEIIIKHNTKMDHSHRILIIISDGKAIKTNQKYVLGDLDPKNHRILIHSGFPELGCRYNYPGFPDGPRRISATMIRPSDIATSAFVFSYAKEMPSYPGFEYESLELMDQYADYIVEQFNKGIYDKIMFLKMHRTPIKI